MQRVQILIREAPGICAHWRFGYRRFDPVGVYLVARTRFEYPPATCVPFSQIIHVLAIVFLITQCYHRV